LGEFLIRTDHQSLTNLTDQRLHTDWQKKALTKLMGLQYRVQYKQGINNGAADALSRKPPDSSQVFAISTVQPAWVAAVIASYTIDDHAQQILQKLAVDSGAVAHFTLVQGVLRYKNRIWVGHDAALRQQLISAFHDSP
jgi:hypothetical protein